MRYLLTGGTSAGVDFAILVMLRSGLDAPLGLSVVCAYLCSAVVNYALLRWWVFTPTRNRPERGRAGQYAVLLGLNVCANFAIVKSLAGLGLDYRIAKLISVAVLAAGNYLMASRVVMA